MFLCILKHPNVKNITWALWVWHALAWNCKQWKMVRNPSFEVHHYIWLHGLICFVSFCRTLIIIVLQFGHVTPFENFKLCHVNAWLKPSKVWVVSWTWSGSIACPDFHIANITSLCMASFVLWFLAEPLSLLFCNLDMSLHLKRF